jgi:hypothetical protein
MQARNLVRPLLVSVALTVAGSAMAQSTDKDRSTTSKQSSTKSSAAKSAAATKRLDFVPSGSVKEAASTRPPGAEQPAQAPAKQGSHCDHSLASDA